MLKYIDNFLNKITMYRLVLYCLTFLWLVAFIISFFGLLPFNAISLFFSLVIISAVCFATNRIFANIYKAPSNIDSVYITIFILALIITPFASLGDFLFIVVASILAIASKYIFAINKKHLFNPAAFAMVFTALAFNKFASASWWIGNLFLAPFVLITGFLITRKIKRADLVVSFFITAIAVISVYSVINGQNLYTILKELIIYSPLMFFAFIMLTEPMTTPPTKKLRIAYGVLVGFLFAPFVHIGSIYFTPEIALISGNIFSYLVSPKEKLILFLKEKVKIAYNTYDFVFNSEKKLNFEPGQYMEWTLGHESQDSRGIRRYFTIASSPTEKEIRIGVKFYEKPSSYKKVLEDLRPSESIVASQLAGDFTLPNDKHKKLIFLAGGIGVTPFRSMIQYLIDTKEKRDIIIFYSNKNFSDIAYKETFDRAKKELGIKTIYVVNDASNAPANFKLKKGMLTHEMIEKMAPDYKDRMFYISGPKSMIDSFDKTLKESGIPKNHIKTDFFPGFA